MLLAMMSAVSLRCCRASTSARRACSTTLGGAACRLRGAVSTDAAARWLSQLSGCRRSIAWALLAAAAAAASGLAARDSPRPREPPSKPERP